MAAPTIIGDSPSIKDILKTVDRIADTNAAVLITGESGTGKEVIARQIHYKSARRDKPFVAVNCGAIPENLLESELFGHEKGSFTGAHEQHKGKFEAAHEGSIFLDEINSLPRLLQGKLLRVLPDGEITRVGGTETIHVNVRIIAATNASLEKLIQEKKLREDLYYRLNVVPIHVPPLRERKDDIPLLLEHFVTQYRKKHNRSVKGFHPDAIAHLIDYRWPGNVRELQNLVERTVALEHREWIHADILPKEIAREGGDVSYFSPFGRGDGNSDPPFLGLDSLEDREKDAILDALKKTAGNRSQAADLLGIHRNTLMKKIKEYGLGT